MEATEDTEATVRAGGVAALGWLAFATLAVIVFIERFAEVPPILAAYAAAVYLLGSD